MEVSDKALMRKGRTVLFSAQKNEGPFLLEWIAYHKVIGFSSIVIVSNNCDDGSDDFLDSLHDAGEVIHLRQDVPADVPPQQNAERVAREAGIFQNGDWVMWLDADEFLLPRGGGKLDSLIDSAGDADALMVAWRFFGDSHNGSWPGRHVSEKFTRAAPRHRGSNAQVKTLFRYSDKIERLDIHRPILKASVNSSNFRVKTSSGEAPADNFFDRTRKNPFNRMPKGKGAYRLGQVVHFSVRTPDLFKKKIERGDGYLNKTEGDKLRDGEFYKRKNFNGVEERGLLIHEAATTAEMRRLLRNPEVKKSCFSIPHFVFPQREEAQADYALPVRYWTAKKNFGDLIGPMIVENLSGRLVKQEKSSDTSPYLLSVGSIIQTIDKPGAIIWGSGLLRPLEPRWRGRLSKNSIRKICAVRGKLTRDQLLEIGLDVPEVFGDPALLLPDFLRFDGSSGKVIVCPHLAHRQWFADLSDPGLQVIDVADDPIQVIRSLATARAVISSSLHGLIVAQAFNVPWVWFSIEDNPLDRSHFKFEDFFSTLEDGPKAGAVLHHDDISAAELIAIASSARRYKLSIDLSLLRDSFPRSPEAL
jgi:hypothetical protein